MKIAIIGAGAAGCFCAVNLKRLSKDVQIDIYEAGNRPLAKVAITGGGRCNLTNTFNKVKSLGQVYPRGERLMKRLMYSFSQTSTMEWWEKESVKLVRQEDECIFPESQDAMQIVSTLTGLMARQHINVHLQHKVASIEHSGNKYIIGFADSDRPKAEADIVVVAVGGSPKPSGLDMYRQLGLEIEEPVPSLFTFKIEDKALNSLMGVVVENTTTSLVGTKFKTEGPLLITHWGMSGPSILKLSSHGARYLAEREYKAKVSVNWYGDKSQNEIAEEMGKMSNGNSKQIGNHYPTHLTSRLWNYLLTRAEINSETRWKELGKKSLNKLVATLSDDIYDITGKGQFKDEFVTCGGVSLKNLDSNTLECKDHKGLYFAGEVTDIDAVTGGFNLQAAWTMGYVVAASIAKSV